MSIRPRCPDGYETWHVFWLHASPELIIKEMGMRSPADMLMDQEEYDMTLQATLQAARNLQAAYDTLRKEAEMTRIVYSPSHTTNKMIGDSDD